MKRRMKGPSTHFPPKEMELNALTRSSSLGAVKRGAPQQQQQQQGTTPTNPFSHFDGEDDFPILGDGARGGDGVGGEHNNDSSSSATMGNGSARVMPDDLETQSSSLVATAASSTNTTTMTTDSDGGATDENVSVYVELLRFAKLSLPNTVVMVLMYLQMAATLSVVDDTEEMTGVSLASLTANLSGLTIVYGLLSAVDTLAPQSYGANNLPEVGILVQRGVVTVFATFLVTIVIWYNAETLLLAFGQPPVESRLAGIFLRYHFLSVPALALWESSRRFMWSQDVVQYPFVVIAFVSFLVHLIGLHVFIPAFGFVGAPIAHVVTNWSMVGGVAVWVKVWKPHHPRTWVLNRDLIVEREAMIRFLKLAVPGILTMSEWVYFEFFIFFSGLLGPRALAANSVAYVTIPLLYTIPSGLSIATTAKIGALLAQGRVTRAKKLGRSIAIVTVCLGATVACLVSLLRENVIDLFTSDPEVRDEARSVWNWLCFFLFLDATFGVQCGLLRALGLQLVYALLVFTCLFVTGLPLVSWFAFPWGWNWGLYGMWCANCFSYVLLNTCLFLAHIRRDWNKYSESVVERERKIRDDLRDVDFD